MEKEKHIKGLHNFGEQLNERQLQNAHSDDALAEELRIRDLTHSEPLIPRSPSKTPLQNNLIKELMDEKADKEKEVETLEEDQKKMRDLQEGLEERMNAPAYNQIIQTAPAARKMNLQRNIDGKQELIKEKVSEIGKIQDEIETLRGDRNYENN